MDEHSYNHIEVVCTLHCQILHHDYQLSQYNVTELFCLTAFICLMAPQCFCSIEFPTTLKKNEEYDYTDALIQS